MAESRAQLEKSSKNIPPRLADVESQRHILARFAEVVPVQSADQSTDKPLPADATIEAKQDRYASDDVSVAAAYSPAFPRCYAQTTGDWSTIPKTEHAGERSVAYW
ncbi:hypothetical protein [Celerinatantimonas diazotrophica]|uniref:Uncharacterized protein n=1 Tax=Celerinatantimonas diazotrophica TaxID=412034 RepID=A0A4R1K451_9GAMM|nr:hypothetical protein [Celerinatantimonas diazotrophica]TCK57769.1 hypothetical protein EV690_1465 [Celerinatantimonas diazotrophica]CAG9298167.1 hypothetical protein CEDIAZO_03362 [Celerinatantimonas diazotrophica]